MKTSGVGLGLMLAVAGCGGGGGGIAIDPSRQMLGSRWNAILSTPEQLAGAIQVKGTAWMAADEGDTTRTRAAVAIENAVPGGEHPWHVHLGRCGDDRGIFGSADAYPPLRVGGSGQAESTVQLREPLPISGEYFVNVHASRNNLGTIIACGNLAPPSR